MALVPGTRLGPYEIQYPLGAGGMGEVYRASDLRLERSVLGARHENRYEILRQQREGPLCTSPLTRLFAIPTELLSLLLSPLDPMLTKNRGRGKAA
jgi:serine/threonine protein kinase